MASFLTMDAAGFKRYWLRMGEASKVCAKPLSSTRGAEAMKILRFGTRGIRQQFADQMEYRGKSAIPWKKGHDFGIKKAPAKTMIGTGGYMSAFLGGAGGISKITPNTIEVGASATKFPQVKIHQGRFASRRIKPKEKVAKLGPNYGQWTMRWFLGLTYGVWIKNSKLTKGLLVHRRRVSVSSAVNKEISKFLRRDILTKIRTGAKA